MTSLFIVATHQESMDALLAQAITEKFPGEFYSVGRGQWLISAPGTAKELCDALGITTDPARIKGTVVLGIAGYYGRASREMWEWMASRLEKA